MKLRPFPVLMLLIAASLACNAPGQSTESPPPAPSISPTVGEGSTIPAATDQPTQPSATPIVDIAGFEVELQSALIAKDFDQVRALMGDAFSVQYVNGASGLISIDDAIILLRDNLLTGSAPIAFDTSTTPNTVIGGEITAEGFTIERARFTRGWGANNADQAILLISLDESGQPYFAGLIYARGGFAGASTPTGTAASANPTGTSNQTPATASAAQATPNPAPRGDLLYQTDFSRGWAIFDEAQVKSQHTNGGYLLTVSGVWAGWSYTTQVNQSGFYAEVEATPQQCPAPAASYGIIFHYTDSSHFRFFIVWCDGHYGLYERTSPTVALELAYGLLPSDVDATTGPHRVGVLAENNTLTLYVDDYRLEAVGVAAMPSGDVGPYIETTLNPTISVLFTGLDVYRLR